MSICLSNPAIARAHGFRHVTTPLREWPRLVLARWRESRRRRALRELLDHSNVLLDDMGLLREEIHWALRLPLSENGLACLHECATRRRRGEFAMLRRRKAVLGLRQW